MKARTAVTFQPGRIETLAKKLRGEVTPSSAAYCRFVALQILLVDAPRSVRPQLDHELKKSLIEALREHLTFLRDSSKGTPLPEDVVNLLINSFSDLLNGEPSSVFMPVKSPTGRGNKRSQKKQRQIVHAVHYLTGVDLGMVPDRRSRQTVANKYGVSRQTVARWLAEAGPIGKREGDAMEFWSIAWNRQPQRMGSLLKKMMMASGKDYRRISARSST